MSGEQSGTVGNLAVGVSRPLVVSHRYPASVAVRRSSDEPTDPRRRNTREEHIMSSGIRTAIYPVKDQDHDGNLIGLLQQP